MITQGTKEFWRTTIALSVGSLLTFANVYFTQPILPLLADEFHVSPILSSMTISLVILALGIALFFYGPISDSFGRRNIMITTMAIATVLTFAIVFTTSFTAFLIIRIIQGLFLAGLPSLAIAYIGEEFAPKALSVAIGIYIGGNTIGGMSGRILSGVASDLLNWRWAFLILGVISLICFVVFVVLLRPSKQFKPKPFSWKNGLIVYEKHLKNPVLLLAYIVGGFHFLFFVGFFTFVTFLLSGKPYHLPPSIIGLLFLTYLAGTISSPIAGKLTIKHRRSSCIWIGISVMLTGALITLIPSIFAILVGLLFICFGFFFTHSITSSWVSRYTEFSKASGSGLYLIFYYIGGSFGPIYLQLFWQSWGWNGIVIGSIPIFIITFICTLKMRLLKANAVKERFIKKAS